MKPDLSTSELKWYEKKAGISQFQKNQAKEKKDIRKKRRDEEKKNSKDADDLKSSDTDKSFSKKKSSGEKSFVKADKTTSRFPQHNHEGHGSHSVVEAKKLDSLFNPKCIPEDASKIIESFDQILLSSTPLTSKQRSLLPSQIRSLSHILTDERSDRRMGYMNQTTTLSAYIYYFLWWNLVRLTRLFSNLPEDYFALKDGDFCLDVGSGPLTVPLALFLARPELRSKKITWYCMDLSAQALNEGENIFLGVAAKLKCEPWKIIRVKGALDTQIKDKVSLVTCANVFNEVVEDSNMPPDFLAKKYSEKLLAYVEKNAASRILVIEPGVPSASRFLKYLREAMMRKGYSVSSPCPHAGECPMEGKKGNGAKWCNFAFATDSASESLKKLSEQADLPKERAVLSFVAFRKDAESLIEKITEDVEKENGENKSILQFRIASDPIRLPGERTGYYACSEIGLLLVVSKQKLHSGDCFSVPYPKRTLSTDKKSGALILNIE